MLTGDMERGHRVGGDLDIQIDKAVGELPAGFDGALNRIITSLRPAQPFFHHRLDRDPLVSGCLGNNAANVAEDEGTGRAMRVMSERVHAWISWRSIRQSAAKVLPDRIAMFGHVEPRGVALT